MKSKTFQKNIKVLEEHIDQLKHVNNVVYLQWVQDLAGNHWDMITKNVYDEVYYWVVIDHYIEYKGQAVLDDVIVAKTYIEKSEGVKSTRIVEFYLDTKLIVRAKTNWALIAKNSNRLVRVPQEIVDLFTEG